MSKDLKKVLISTFNNSKNNYGAVFQACALSKTIKKLGYDVSFLTVGQRDGIHPIKPKFLVRIKNIIKKILSLPTRRKRAIRTQKFKDFVKNTQKTIAYRSNNDIALSPPDADIYLSGSDQVWNPKNIHPELFMSFSPDDKPLVSYAASMGTEQIPKENEDIFAKYISRYDCVSVREDTMIDIISKYTDKEIHQNIDPVFLLDKEDWLKISKKYNKLKYDRYILLYLIEWSQDDNERLISLKQETGLPLVLVTLGGTKPKFADQVIMDASPEEFLYLISNAEMVVASSFHGIALSIIFNKPFIAVSGKDKPTRIESLLRHYKLESHNTTDINTKNAACQYDFINQQIKEDQTISREYLLTALNFEK